MNITTATNRFKWSLDEDRLNTLGKETGLCQRKRTLTPHRLMLALLDSFASGSVKTLADIHRRFNALCGQQVQYKPFHKQLAKPGFPVFVRETLTQMLNELATQALQFTPDSPFARFTGIHIQDGTSFALKPALAHVFPGRFGPQNPAAVELHVNLDLLCESPNHIALTPDTAAEIPQLPAPEECQGSLMLADRGYFSKPHMQAIDAAGGFFLIRGKTNADVLVERAYRPDGREIRAWRGTRLQDHIAQLPRYAFVDLDVRFDKRKPDFTCRLVVHSRTGQKESLRFLFTNLSRDDFTASHIHDAYRLRWQIELVFKEWKSYAGLRAFDTANPHIAEGLIWAALCAAVVKRFWAHVTQHIARQPISTQKAAKCIPFVLGDILRAILLRPQKLLAAARAAIKYLANNARRAHPDRDRKTGRLKLGLECI